MYFQYICFFGGFTAIYKAHSLAIIRNIVPYLHRIRYTREREILCGVVFNENEADVFFSFSLSVRSFVRWVDVVAAVAAALVTVE